VSDPVAEKKAPSPPKAEKKPASTGFFGNIFGGLKADAQVEESASVTNGTTEDDFEPRDVALKPDSHIVNTENIAE